MSAIAIKIVSLEVVSKGVVAKTATSTFMTTITTVIAVIAATSIIIRLNKGLIVLITRRARGTSVFIVAY